METRLGQYCITVADLEKAEEFYTRILGLEVRQRIEFSEAREVVLGTEGSDASLQLAQRHDQQGPIQHSGAFWKHYLYTSDIAKTFGDAVAYGCEAVSAPQKLEEWAVTIAFIKDPDGYLIELIERH